MFFLHTFVQQNAIVKSRKQAESLLPILESGFSIDRQYKKTLFHFRFLIVIPKIRTSVGSLPGRLFQAARPWVPLGPQYDHRQLTSAAFPVVYRWSE